jgi:hypothetical protein
MRLGGLDIATTTGFACADGEVITASSFRSGAKRAFDLARGEVDYDHEGIVAREFRDHLRAWLVSNEIEALGIEQPLTPNLTIKKPVVNFQSDFAGQAITYETKGATTYGTIYRLYILHGQAVELAKRLNIKPYVVHQATWRKAFFGDMRPPKGCTDKSKWWKEQAKMQCHRLGIEVKNADAAESVGVAFWLRGALNPRTAGTADDLFRKAGS